MLRNVLLAFLVLLVGFVGWALYRRGLKDSGPAAQPPQRRTIANPPSFVVIVGDAIGYGDLGCYGQKIISTPRIDGLAKDGIRLTNFYAGDPTGRGSGWCLMTGRDMSAARAEGAARFVLQPQQATIAAVLRAAGYRTGLVGTWTLGGGDPANTPGRHGFEEWAVLPSPESAEFPESLWKNDQMVAVAGNADGKRACYLTDVLLEEATSFLQQAGSEPFALFLVLPLSRASTNLPALDAYADRDWSESRKCYAARIGEFDRAVGSITTELDRLKLADRTVMLVTSSGGSVSTEAEDRAFFQGTGGLRGANGELYEGGLRVPCLVRSANQAFKGVQRDYPAAMWDVLPTLAELSGAIQVPKQRDGVSMAGMLHGGIGESRDMFYWDIREGQRVGQAVRMGDWKVVRPPGKTLAADCELYDLAKDPRETGNVAKQHPEIIEKFLK
jgi:arylsulfatase A-like enzyme